MKSVGLYQDKKTYIETMIINSFTNSLDAF